MVRAVDIERLRAFAELLELPDAADLVGERGGRGHRVTCGAYPAKREATLRQVTAVHLADRRKWHADISRGATKARLVPFSRRG